jgi:hypothetical protein
MLADATLRPGQKGAKRLLEKHGDRLGCVRYPYDSGSGRPYAPVELLESIQYWTSTIGYPKLGIQ